MVQTSAQNIQSMANHLNTDFFLPPPPLSLSLSLEVQ